MNNKVYKLYRTNKNGFKEYIAYIGNIYNKPKKYKLIKNIKYKQCLNYNFYNN